jgi:DNA repair protein RecO (recombination protein O)
VGTRVQQEPGYILHHRPFRDTSQILDILTRDHGKIAVVARGSRGAKSRLAGVLRPFLPLRISWVAKSDLGTLTGAEAAGRPAGLHGDALLAAYYINELVMHFLLRHDPQPEIYALYASAVADLGASASIAGTLRRFELEFLGLLGYAVSVDRVAGTEDNIDAGRHYEYRVEQGPVPVERTSGDLVFPGALLQAIAAGRFEDEDVLSAAGRLLRKVIEYHLGGKELQTRKVLRDVHRGRIAAPDERNP